MNPFRFPECSFYLVPYLGGISVLFIVILKLSYDSWINCFLWVAYFNVLTDTFQFCALIPCLVVWSCLFLFLFFFFLRCLFLTTNVWGLFRGHQRASLKGTCRMNHLENYPSVGDFLQLANIPEWYFPPSCVWGRSGCQHLNKKLRELYLLWTASISPLWFNLFKEPGHRCDRSSDCCRGRGGLTTSGLRL